MGNIAEALRLAYATSHEKEYQDEKARRVYYQDIVYDVCNTLDRLAGRSVAKGQGIVCGTKDEPHDNVQKGVKTLESLARAALAECEAKYRLMQADALIVAEIERLDRSALAPTQQAPDGDNK